MIPARLRCPSAEEEAVMLADLLPRGRAWDGARRDGTVMARFFRALADPLADLEARLCALWLEWFCATATVTRDWWLTDHGLPDACDPYPDPCIKRASLAATRCEAWVALAALAGWSITCREVVPCGGRSGTMRAGHRTARTGRGWPGPTVVITADLAASPAWTAPRTRPPLAGRYRAGQAAGCGADISALICLLERLIPDHVARAWRTIHG